MKVFLQGFFAALAVSLFAMIGVYGNNAINGNTFEVFSTSKIEAMPNSNKLKSIATTVDNNSSEKNSSRATLQGVDEKSIFTNNSIPIKNNQVLSFDKAIHLNEHVIASFDMKKGTSTKLEPLMTAINFNKHIVKAPSNMKDPALSDRYIELKKIKMLTTLEPRISTTYFDEHIIALFDMKNIGISTKLEPLAKAINSNENTIEPPNMKTLTLSEYGSLKNRGMSTILNPLTKGINSNGNIVAQSNMIATFNKASVRV